LIFVWSRYGLLVPAFVAGGLLVAYLAVMPFGLEPERAQGLALAIAGVLAGAANYFVAQKLEGVVPLLRARPETNERDERPEAGHFMFVPMRYWALILPVLGLAVATASHFGLMGG
jgi:hypothetical protein